MTDKVNKLPLVAEAVLEAIGAYKDKEKVTFELIQEDVIVRALGKGAEIEDIQEYLMNMVQYLYKQDVKEREAS